MCQNVTGSAGFLFFSLFITIIAVSLHLNAGFMGGGAGGVGGGGFATSCSNPAQITTSTVVALSGLRLPAGPLCN